jgi:hypothetical protein
MPEELLSIIRQERDDDVVEVEGESYLFSEDMNEGDIFVDEQNASEVMDDGEYL